MRKFSKRGFCTLLAIVGVAVTVFCTAKDTVGAQKKLDEKKPETVVEKVKTAAPCYISTAVSAGATILFIGLTHHIGTKEIAGTSALGAAIGKRFKNYRKGVIDEYGEEVDKELYVQAVDKDHCVYPPLPQNMTDESDEVFLFRDMYLNKWFKTTLPHVIEAMYHLNRNLQAKGEILAEEWYDFLGVKLTDKERKKVKEVGWNMGYYIDTLEYDFVWIDFYTEYVKYKPDYKFREPYYKLYFDVDPSKEALEY